MTVERVIEFERPLMSPNPDGTWSLMADWSVYLEGHWFRLPSGFVTDGASIPRLLWRVCGTPMDVPRLYAAMVHDWIYSGGDPDATRSDADLVYRKILIALDYPRIKAYIEYFALRVFGGRQWRKFPPSKSRSKIMRKLIVVAALMLASAVCLIGCKSITVDRRGHQVALDGAGQVVKDVAGNPIILDLGWSCDYFQHWNWQRFDSMRAKAGEGVELQINGYASGADTNLVTLVNTSLNGVALITEKVLAAVATQGCSIIGGAGEMALKACIEKFKAAGGNEADLQVTCKDGSCTLSDGTVTEVCENCIAK